MAKIVRQIAEIVSERCTGCALCTFTCPTAALRMIDRPSGLPGPSRKLAVIDDSICYNAQNCLELCPDDAIRMIDLDEPRTVGAETPSVDADAVAGLCLAAALLPDGRVCFCAEVSAGELAAAILAGATTPDALARATGGRTGCTEICVEPTLRLLEAAGHGDAPPNPPRGFQWYGTTGRLIHQLDESFQAPDELVDAYPTYPIRRDVNVLLGNLGEG
jgi:Fe-S-cluster-containing hydrogenase component 2